MNKVQKREVFMALVNTNNVRRLSSYQKDLLIGYHNEIVESGYGKVNRVTYSIGTRCGSCLTACRASVLHHYKDNLEGTYKDVVFSGRLQGKYNEPVYIKKPKSDE